MVIIVGAMMEIDVPETINDTNNAETTDLEAPTEIEARKGPRDTEIAITTGTKATIKTGIRVEARQCNETTDTNHEEMNHPDDKTHQQRKIKRVIKQMATSPTDDQRR